MKLSPPSQGQKWRRSSQRGPYSVHVRLSSAERGLCRGPAVAPAHPQAVLSHGPTRLGSLFLLCVLFNLHLHQRHACGLPQSRRRGERWAQCQGPGIPPFQALPLQRPPVHFCAGACTPPDEADEAQSLEASFQPALCIKVNTHPILILILGRKSQ